MRFEGGGWTASEQSTGTAAVNLTGNKLASVLNERHFGWALTGQEAFKLTHHGSVTLTRTGQSCAQATEAATDDCWGRTTSSTTVEVYTNAADVTGEHHWFVHEFGHTFEASVGDSIPSTALQQAQDTNQAFPDRVAGDDGLVNKDETWGFAGTRWSWQLSASADANEELADMYVGWVYNQFEDSPLGQMRADFMSSNVPLWVNLAATR